MIAPDITRMLEDEAVEDYLDLLARTGDLAHRERGGDYTRSISTRTNGVVHCGELAIWWEGGGWRWSTQYREAVAGNGGDMVITPPPRAEEGHIQNLEELCDLL